MTVTFVELHAFARVRREYFVDDAHFREFQNALLYDPHLGAVIPGAGGIRKVRWPDPRRGKGKRGGLRVLYRAYAEAAIILLLAVYDKSIEDLTTEQREALARSAEQFEAELARLAEQRS